MLKKYEVEIKWGVIFIVSLLLWSVLEKVLGYHDTKIGEHAQFSMLFFIPAVLLYVFALLEKKKKSYGGQMNFKQGFMAGLIISVIVAVFNPLTQYIISFVIAPEYFDNVIAYSVENEKATLEEAQAYFNYQSYAVQGTIFAFLMGVVTSLVVALFIRTKNK
jgi:membrane glycosyltransferase